MLVKRSDIKDFELVLEGDNIENDICAKFNLVSGGCIIFPVFRSPGFDIEDYPDTADRQVAVLAEFLNVYTDDAYIELSYPLLRAMSVYN